MRIHATETQLLLIDMQARLLPHIHERAAVQRQCVRLLQAAGQLNIPVTALEQYKQGLGETPDEIRGAAGSALWYEKTTFSGCGDERVTRHLANAGRRSVVLLGIEAHVCVLKTALDLLASDYQPIVVVDAVGSRRAMDRDVALRRMDRSGAVLTTVESLIFEWLDDCRSQEFKQILPLVKA